MRKVVAYELLSLDGVAESPDRFFETWDDRLDANLARVIDRQDDVVLGHRSFDDWAAYWPGRDIQPFSAFINAVPKHVAASTPLTTDWSGATRIEGDLVDHVRALKDRPGGDIGLHASISVVQALLAAGLVDELRLVVAPVVVGSGRRLLDGLPTIRLEAIGGETTPSGARLLDYRVHTG